MNNDDYFLLFVGPLIFGCVTIILLGIIGEILSIIIETGLHKLLAGFFIGIVMITSIWFIGIIEVTLILAIWKLKDNKKEIDE